MRRAGLRDQRADRCVYALDRRSADPAGRGPAPGPEYAEAGGDCLFVPGLADLAVLESLVARSPLPIGASTGPGPPTVVQLRAAGVRPVSVGPALTQAAYTVTRQLAGELLRVGRLTTESPCLDYARLNSLFPGPLSRRG